MSDKAVRCGTRLPIRGPSGRCSAPSEIEETDGQCPSHQLRELLLLNAPNVQDENLPRPGRSVNTSIAVCSEYVI
jgi:hypothetical protein